MKKPGLYAPVRVICCFFNLFFCSSYCVIILYPFPYGLFCITVYGPGRVISCQKILFNLSIVYHIFFGLDPVKLFFLTSCRVALLLLF